MTNATAHPVEPIRLLRFRLSGHSHRVELFLSLLRLPYVLVDVALASGEHKRPEFLALNPFGQVPVIQDGAVTVADSNAILVYLASKYDSGTWLPRDPAGAAAVQRWLSVAAGQLVQGPAKARMAKVFKLPGSNDEATTLSHRLFAVMEGVLKDAPYLTGPSPTIADIAMYTYTAHAPEGDLSLDDYPSVRRWLQRIEALPGFVSMAKSAVNPAG
jgi:glutathione S-transferase